MFELEILDVDGVNGKLKKWENLIQFPFLLEAAFVGEGKKEEAETCRVRENKFETLNWREIVLDEESCVEREEKIN